MNTLFSVVITAYNREEYLRQTVDSVLSQTCPDYELIVVDDGSTDGTQELLKSYGSRIRNILQENQGPGAAFKAGASLATGKYLAFLDGDDLFMPYALETYERIIRALDSPLVIIGSMTRFRDGQEVQIDTRCPEIIEVLKYQDYVSKDVGIGLSLSRIVMKRSTFEEVKDMQDSAASSYLLNNDYTLMLQAGSQGPCVIVKTPTIVAYRQHENQISLNIEKMVVSVLSLINLVRRGQCYGEKTRLFAKYAFLGGHVGEWVKKALRHHRPKLALKLLMKGWPMMAAAVLRKGWLQLCPTSTVLTIITHVNPEI